ncbi:hypothetical protein BDQ17DRAFT_1437079 [Cyathus striatus]|nr:hypothetical protein BDQ17DRAFT_1437079 [Cyathus striatus]
MDGYSYSDDLEAPTAGVKSEGEKDFAEKGGSGSGIEAVVTFRGELGRAGCRCARTAFAIPLDIPGWLLSATTHVSTLTSRCPLSPYPKSIPVPTTSLSHYEASAKSFVSYTPTRAFYANSA